MIGMLQWRLKWLKTLMNGQREIRLRASVSMGIDSDNTVTVNEIIPYTATAIEGLKVSATIYVKGASKCLGYLIFK